MNAITQPYWDHLARGVFAMPRCRACGRFHFYPRVACPHCSATDFDWAPVSGRGTVLSYSIVQRAPSAAFAADVPYVVAIIRTEEGPQLMSRVVGCPPDAVRIGQAVTVDVNGTSGGRPMPVFRLRDHEPTA